MNVAFEVAVRGWVRIGLNAETAAPFERASPRREGVITNLLRRASRAVGSRALYPRGDDGARVRIELGNADQLE